MNLSITQQMDIARQLCPDLAPILARHAHELPREAAAGLTLSRAAENMESAKTHQAEATRMGRRSLFTLLFSRCPEFAKMPLFAITPEHIQRALDKCWPEALTNWNKGRTALCALFNYAIRHQWVHMANPAAALDVKHVEEREIRALSPEHLRALLRGTLFKRFSHLQAYIAICAFAGVRPTECARLTWADVDLTEGTLTIQASASKTGGARHVAVHPTLREWLIRARPADVSPDSLITRKCALPAALSRLRAASGLRGQWQADVLRHSYATYYIKAGGKLEELQWNMGHKDTSLLYSRYINMRGVTHAHAKAWWSLTPEKVYR